MNCIHDDLIQKYIDGEANPEEVTFVENHINDCNKCLLRIENQRKLATHVKNAINHFAGDAIEIPKFEIPSKDLRKHILTTKRLSFIIAAASILFFIIVITQKKEMKKDDQIIFEIGTVMDVDANRPASNFPLVINIIDTRGNISEYLIK